jgi:hypothetical protein
MSSTTSQDGQPAPMPATAVAPRHQFAIPHIPVRVVDSRPPFAPLAMLSLTEVPRPGDGIRIDLAGRRVGYKVDFVNFEPYDPDAHVTLGCSLNQPAIAGGQPEPAKINEFVQQQDQFFQKFEAYSKTIIALGYAGLFAVWGFVKDHLQHRAVVAVALLVGFSLVVYIASEIVEMQLRGLLQYRLNKATEARPEDYANAINDFVKRTRTAQKRGAARWRVVLPLTVIPAFSGALLLLYNASASLTGLPEWP